MIGFTPKLHLCGCVLLLLIVVLPFRLQQKKNLLFMENSGLVLLVTTCIFRLSDKLLADYGIPIRSWDHARFVNLGLMD